MPLRESAVLLSSVYLCLSENCSYLLDVRNSAQNLLNKTLIIHEICTSVWSRHTYKFQMSNLQFFISHGP
jgi:hypothetical protein